MAVAGTVVSRSRLRPPSPNVEAQQDGHGGLVGSELRVHLVLEDAEEGFACEREGRGIRP